MAGTITQGVINHRRRGIARTDVDITCDASGVATATPVGVGWGRLVAVYYNGGLDASAVITIADAKTGKSIVAYTTGTEGTPVAFRPTDIVTDNAGTAITASGNAVGVHRDIYLGGRVTVAVASGGVSETAKLALVVDESHLYDPPLTV